MPELWHIMQALLIMNKNGKQRKNDFQILRETRVVIAHDPWKLFIDKQDKIQHQQTASKMIKNLNVGNYSSDVYKYFKNGIIL